jgi:crossover junction endodeoxyribonuclease RusA
MAGLTDRRRLPRLPALALFVPGVPRSKGSMRAFVPKGSTRAIITASGSGLKEWEQNIRVEALRERQRIGWPVLDEAVAVFLHFLLPRPVSLPKRVREHLKKPDLDKLVRAVLDALTPVLWRDDALVVSIMTTKTYASEEPGVYIEVCRREG